MKKSANRMQRLIKHNIALLFLYLLGNSAEGQVMNQVVPDGFAIVHVKDMIEYDRLHPTTRARVADGPWEGVGKWDWKSRRELPDEIPDPNQPMLIDPFGKMTPPKTGIGSHTQRLASPSPISTFVGCDDNGLSIPPDVNGAVGPGHTMVTLNSQIKFSDRSGSQISIVSLKAFWSQINPAPLDVFDPKVLYDPYFGRWITVACAERRSDSTALLIGISHNSDPTGAWYHQRFLYNNRNGVFTPSGNWFDYPGLGYNNKWIVITGNIFDNSDNFVNSEIFVFKKSDLYAGAAAPGLTRFNYTGSTVQPAVTHDNSTTTPLYLVNRSTGNLNGSGIIRLFRIDGNVGTPAFSVVNTISTPNPWARTAQIGFGFAPQLGSNERIDTGDDRIQKVVYRNGSIWCVHTVFLPAATPTRSALQWWQLTPTAALTQRGRIDDTNGIFYAYPSIEVNQNNDALIGFSQFSSTTYGSAAYAMRYGTDAVNTFQSPFMYKSGLAPYFRTFGTTENRWGDYSTVCLDPNNPNNFFTLQEYASSPVNGSDRWGTWWANVAGNNAKTSRYVVTDVTANKAFYYSTNFDLITSNTLSTNVIGGLTNAADVCTRPGGSGAGFDYVLDGTNRKVIRSSLTGKASSVSRELRTTAGAKLSSPTGIEVWGDSLYVLDKGGKAIYRYSLLSAFIGVGSLNASQRILLTSANSRAESMRIQGAGSANLLPSIYVLDDNSTKRIYNYSLTGSYVGASNALAANPTLSNVTGLSTSSSLNPNLTFDWFFGIVDRGRDRYYEFKNLTFGNNVPSATATVVRSLNTANLNCTGIDFSSNPGILRETEDPSLTNAVDRLQLTAFPNPTTGWINLLMRGLEPGETRIRIFDLMGRQFSDRIFGPDELPANEMQLDLSTFSSGNYLITVENRGARKSLIVQKQ